MKVLFISQYYPPEIGAASNRIGYFAQFLAKAGHDVTVLTSAPNYPEGKIYAGYANRFDISEENGVRVIRTRILLTAKSNAITRLAHYLSFLISSIMVKRKIPKPELIFATSPPLFTALIGVIFKKLWRVPLVTDIRDIWPESVESVGAVKNKKLLRQGEKLAHWIYKNSGHITATSPGIQKKLTDVPVEKITIIPNGAELDLFRPDISGDYATRMWNLKSKFVVLYTGNLGLAQAPETIIKAAEILKDNENVVFLLVGSGVLLQKLKAEAEKKNLTNVILAGSNPRTRMPEFVAASDVCLIPYKAADTFRNTFPSKMFDYMAGAKPIIINLEGEASKLIEQAKCGILAKEENAQDMADTILELQKNPAFTRQMGQSGRIFVEKNYQRENIAIQLEKTLKCLVKQ